MKITINKDFAGFKAGSVVSWEVFVASQHPQNITIESARHLMNGGLINFNYPICFIGIEEEQLMVYSARNWILLEPMYGCPNSEKTIPYSSLKGSAYIPLYTEKEISDFFRVQPVPTVRLCGEIVEEGKVIHYIHLEDMAWGQVKYFDGMIGKYPNSEYLFFLSEGERNNLLHSMTEGTSLAKF